MKQINQQPCTRRSCDELGVCQERYPACGGCMASHDTTRMTAPMATGPRLRLAPGAVEGYRVGFFGTARQRRELVGLLKSAARWTAVLVACALAAGFWVGTR